MHGLAEIILICDLRKQGQSLTAIARGAGCPHFSCGEDFEQTILHHVLL